MPIHSNESTDMQLCASYKRVLMGNYSAISGFYYVHGAGKSSLRMHRSAIGASADFKSYGAFELWPRVDWPSGLPVSLDANGMTT